MRQLFNDEQKKYLAENYGILSYAEMASHFGMKPSQIKAWFRNNRPVPLVGRGTSKHSRKIAAACDEDFFSRETEEAYYWAGFIAADGHISIKRNYLGIMLQASDKSHLERLKSALSYEGNIIESKKGYAYKGHTNINYCCVIRVVNKKIVNDLIERFNITERKTFTYRPPNIDDPHLKSCFIKGYIDGDGTIQKVEDIRWAARVSVIGTLEMMTFIKGHVEFVTGRKLSEKAIRRHGDENKNTFTVTITNTTSKLFLRELAKIPIELPRKWAGVGILSSFTDDPRKSYSKETIELVKCLNKLGYTQRELSDIIGIHQASISMIALGKTTARSDEMEQAIKDLDVFLQERRTT